MASHSFWLKAVCYSLAVLLLTFYLFLAREARNEIYFLCSNFSVGNDQADVLRQLNTAELSDYRSNVTDAGAEIVLSSKLHFRQLQCTIRTDASELITSVQYN